MDDSGKDPKKIRDLLQTRYDVLTSVSEVQEALEYLGYLKKSKTRQSAGITLGEFFKSRHIILD